MLGPSAVRPVFCGGNNLPVAECLCYLPPDSCHFLCLPLALLQTLLGGHYTCQCVYGLNGTEEWCGVGIFPLQTADLESGLEASKY